MGEGLLTGASGRRGDEAVVDSPLFADAGIWRIGGSLQLGGVPLSAIADGDGTPAYVYNAEVIRRQFRALDAALSPEPHRIA
jgi:hypothetical protein